MNNKFISVHNNSNLLQMYAGLALSDFVLEAFDPTPYIPKTALMNSSRADWDRDWQVITPRTTLFPLYLECSAQKYIHSNELFEVYTHDATQIKKFDVFYPYLQNRKAVENTFGAHSNKCSCLFSHLGILEFFPPCYYTNLDKAKVHPTVRIHSNFRFGTHILYLKLLR